MKIVQRGEDNGDVISTVLNNRNIENLELFLSPNNSNDSDPMEFLNADLGRELLMSHIEKGNKIVILVDADADGYTSSATLYQYIKDIAPNADVDYIVHEGKAHGLTDNVMLEILSEIHPQLVITPDAGSNDVRQIEKLIIEGIDFMAIDHHVVSEVSNYGLIINNQLCPVTNHQLVGAGVVYKFIQGIDIKLGHNFADKYLDLVAVGQIGDASDISTPEIRNLVTTGLKKINNKFLKEAINQKLGFGTNATPKDLSFNVIPLINAVTRVGTTEEREQLFESLCGIGDGRIFKVEKKKKNQTTGKFDKIMYDYNIYQYGYHLATKAKSRQDSVVKKMVKQLEESVIDDTGIIIAYSDNNDNPGITGLIANKLSSKFDKPALLLNQQEDTFTGSGRGHEKTLEDFRQWCEDSGVIEWARGHDNAFGICIPKDNIDLFKEYSRTIKKKELVYEVDVLTDRPSTDDCRIVDNNKYLFGGSVTEPLIGIINMEVPRKFFTFKGNMMTIYSYGVSMVQFSANKEFVEKFHKSNDGMLYLNVVGNYSMNNWSGREIPQLIIKDIELIEQQEETQINYDELVF